MLIADLMEKAESGQFAILSFLLQKNQVTIREVAQELDFSRATLLKYVDLLNEKADRAGLGLSVRVADDSLRLDLAVNLQAREIRQLFLDNSIKQQILCHLLYRQNFSIQRLAQDLLISEATLNRHLLMLNRLLAEFSISIQNGRLKGSEHQIRYFYFLLFRKLWSKERFMEEFSKPERLAEIREIEGLCQAELRQEQKMDLVLWCHISQQRLQAKGGQFQALSSSMKPYFTTIFYQRLLKCSSNFFKGQYLSVQAEDAEIMILFAFLLSQHILPVYTLEYNLGFGGPIADLTTQLIQELKREGLFLDSIDGQITYELSQLCAQAYIFRGYILQDNFKYESQLRLPYVSSDQHYLPLAQAICGRLSLFHQDTDLDRKILWELLKILDFILENESKKIRIGLDLLGSQLVFHRMKTTLLQFLEYNQFVDLGPIQKGGNFDLIISNNPLSEFSKANIYYLKSDMNEEDLIRIRELLARIN